MNKLPGVDKPDGICSTGHGVRTTSQKGPREFADKTARTGFWLGSLAVVFWSFGSSLIYLGAKETGTWRFVAIATSTGGLLQMAFRIIYQRELSSALFLPWKLWAGPLVCFVLYGLVWPGALANAAPNQVGAVNLINYLWPVLTVVFCTWLVPGLQLSRTIFMATLLAIAGLLCANARPLRELLESQSSVAGTQRWTPFILASVAASTWALYSAMLARWRAWARNYVTSPVGFIFIGLIASLILTTHGKSTTQPSRAGLTMTFLYGAGPLGAGYLLWELALARAKVQSLSLIAAATPVLSTIVLAAFLRTLPGIDLVLAALLISAGVVLSMRNSAGSAKEDLAADPADIGNPLPQPKGFQDKAPGTS